MFPVLLRLGRFEVHSYGLMLAISFLVGIYWAMHRSQKKEIQRNVIMDLSLIIVLCAIIGSRALYVVTHLDEFKGHWWDAISPFQSSGQIGISGLTMLGGILLALIAVAVFCLIKRISILKLGDIMALPLASGIFITRIGCFLNGCCFGKPCNLPWGMVFPLQSPAGYIHQGIHIHPTQLYSSLYGLIILLALIFAEQKQKFDGLVFFLFFALYGIARFFVDFVRSYEVTQMVNIFGISLTNNQWISLVLSITGISCIIFWSIKRNHA
jgi:phosphatidylglycerol:prolipoprotein diacylglycerol transferase